MDVEEVLERVGGWGRYQKVIYFLGALPSIVGGIVTMAYSWTAFFMEHRCLVDGCEDPTNATYSATFLNWSTPPDEDHTWSRCEMYRPNTAAGSCTNNSFFKNQTVPCKHWVYDKSVMESTVVSEFNLVCDRETLWPLENSLYFVGVGVGSVLCGAIADRFGRRFALLLCVVLTAVPSIAGAFAPNYGTFAALRFVVAVFAYGLLAAPFVLSMEITSIEMRAACGIMINAFYAIGEALVGMIPIFEKDWSNVQLIFSAPILLFCSYWFFFPESPRWFISANQPDKAEQVLRNIAKWNKTKFPEDLVTPDKKTEDTGASSNTSDGFMMVLKSPVLLKRACVLSTQWAVVALVYYGVGLVSTDLAGDVYLNFILTMLIEIPAYIFCALFINPVGRKLMFAGSFALSGLGTIGAGLVTNGDLEWLTTTLALLGKFGASGAFSLAYVYTAELYPDALRSVGVGVASATGRIGSILAPFIADMGQESTALPLCIFGAAGLVAAALTMLLPETSGHELPNNIEEAIQFGRGQPLLPVPFLMARRQRKLAELRGFDGPQSDLTALDEAPQL